MSNNKPRQIVIVGGVACGPKAAARARRRDPEAEITLIEKGDYLSYAGCGLPYYIGGGVRSFEGLMSTPYGVVRDPDYFEDFKGLNVRVGTLAEKIDRDRSVVQVKDLKSGEKDEIPYDSLVLATGASPAGLPIPGTDLGRVFSLHVPQDALRIRELVEGGEVDRAVLIGGGRISLEASEALFAHAVDSVVVEMEDQLVPTGLDPEMAALITSELEANDAEVYTSERAVRLEGDDNGNVCRVVTDSQTLDADMVLVAVGVRPNADLARDAGLRRTDSGAIWVDEFLRTSDPNIYAGGDCVECPHILSGEHVYAPLGSTANRHGRIIGDNITGGNEKFPGVVGTWVMKVMRINVAATGWTEQEARKRGRNVSTCLIPATDHAHYFPGGKTFTLKMVVDGDNRRFLGAQIIGPGDVTKRIDILATALRFGSSVDDVANLDLAYAPPYSTALDSVIHAANVIRNKLDGTVASISPTELQERVRAGEPVLVVDVRESAEVEKSPIEGVDVLTVPLGDIRKRTAEIPQDKDLVCVCAVGLRGYEASKALAGAGFSRSCFLDGGLRVWEVLNH